MKPFSFSASLALAVCLAIPAAAQVDYGGTEVVHPYQRVSATNLAAITATNGSDPAIAKAAVNIVLSRWNVKCDPDSQLEGILEATTGPSVRTLASRISGVSCITGGRAQRLAASFTPNGAIQGDNLIASLMADNPLLLGWKRTLYVLYGVVYDEHIYADGSRTNVIRQFLLIDPRYSDKRRFLAFEREKHSFAEVEGVASVVVGPQ